MYRAQHWIPGEAVGVDSVIRVLEVVVVVVVVVAPDLVVVDGVDVLDTENTTCTHKHIRKK
jgi:hypothetical protein